MLNVIALIAAMLTVFLYATGKINEAAEQRMHRSAALTFLSCAAGLLLAGAFGAVVIVTLSLID